MLRSPFGHRRWSLGVLLLLAGAVTGCGGGGGQSLDEASLVRLLTTSVPAGVTGVDYVTEFTAVFPNPPGAFQVVNGALPPGLLLDKRTGILSGYPRQVGNFSFTISARDGRDTSLPPDRDQTFAEDRRAFNLAVSRGLPNILPQVLPSAQYRASYGYQIDLAGGTPPYTFAKTGGSLPNGITVSSSGFVGSFPTSAQPDPYVFQVTVTDAMGEQDTETLELDVVVLPLIILTPSPLPEAAQDFAYSEQLELASAGAGQPITWSQVLPPGPGEVDLASLGMEVTSLGVVRNAAPAPGPNATGTFRFTVQVTDEANQVATRQYAIKVNPGPVLTLVNPNKAVKPGPYTATGLNFAPGAQLIFKPGPTQIVITPTYVNPTTLTFATAPPAPAGAGGYVTVRVLNPDGGFHDLPAAFAFPASNLTFSTTATYPSPQSALSSTGLAVGDVNRDGFADILHCGSNASDGAWSNATGTTGGVDLLLNAAPGGAFDGTFTKLTMASGGQWHGVKLADVDSDGDLDLVAMGMVSGTIVTRTWRNPYPAAFSAATPYSETKMPYQLNYPQHVSDFAVGRITAGDTVPDLVYAYQDYSTTTYTNWAIAGGSVTSVQGNGNGTFSTSSIEELLYIYDHTTATGVALAQLNGAAGDDMVVTDGGGGYGLYWNGVGTVKSAHYVPTNPATGLFGSWTPLQPSGMAGGVTESLGVATTDVTGDGNLDVLTASGGNYYGWSGVGVLAGSGSGAFTALSASGGTAGLYRYVTGFDGDFDLPFDVAATVNNGRIDIWKGRTGTLGLQFKQTITLSGSNLGRISGGDFNNDGREDLCAAMSFLADERMQTEFYYWYQGTRNARGLGSTQGVVIFLNTSN